MTEKKRLLVCSLSDLPSVNMKCQLFKKRSWEVLGRNGKDIFHANEEAVVMITPDLHIRLEDLDKRIEEFGLNIGEVVFMSKHAATSGEAAMTVHPIGNFKDNKYGGKKKTLVKANPSLMTDALRKMSQFNNMSEFKVCFEVTHHGPWLERPTFFIEIGSDSNNWGNENASHILSEVILNMEPNDYETVIGVGGGHYAPRFTEVALEYKINFGHMLPNYQMEKSDDADILRMVKDASAASDTKLVYIHRNSMKGPEEKRVTDLISSAGFELISSSDLERINES